MELEREIEKLLRAYVKKRRGQAGDSFKLDPSTRRMLQNEISRSEPLPEEDDDTMSLWEVLRRNWMFFLGFAVCIFVLASFFFRAVNTAQKKALLSMSSQSLRTEDMRQIPGSAQPALAKGETPVTNALFAKRAYPQRPLALNSDNADNVSAPAPVLSPPAVGTVVESREPRKDASTVSADGNYAAVPTPSAGLSGLPTANEERAQTFGAEPISGSRGQNSFKNTIAARSRSSAVLMNFQVMQNGNTIRVVDQDGSVYTGTLQPEEPGGGGVPSPIAPAGTEVNADTPKIESPRTTEADKLAPSQPSAPPITNGLPPAGASGAPSPPVYSFRVGGMNRTLNQRVVFTATLTENLETMKNTQVTFGMGSGQSNQTAQLPWSTLRIAGTAVVDRTNEIRIDAMPVTSTKSNMPPN